MSTHQIIQGLVVTVNRKLDETSGFLLLSLFVLRRYWRRADPPDGQRPVVNGRVQVARPASRRPVLLSWPTRGSSVKLEACEELYLSFGSSWQANLWPFPRALFWRVPGVATSLLARRQAMTHRGTCPSRCS
jgi:hypothetical protein